MTNKSYVDYIVNVHADIFTNHKSIRNPAIDLLVYEFIVGLADDPNYTMVCHPSKALYKFIEEGYDFEETIDRGFDLFNAVRSALLHLHLLRYTDDD